MKIKDKRIYDLIDEILWHDWDPIGVNDFEEARDEYSGYTLSIFNLKISGANKSKISKYLFSLEKVNMGLFGNIVNCEIVAEKIVNVK